MSAPRRAAAPDRAGADPPVPAQLDRLLRSTTFRQADRLKRFLSFIVNEALAGRAAELKEYVIGVQVFRKEESFDPRTDPIVRVQARRLRAKLVHYYQQEGPGDALVIELPKGGYAPVFRHRDAPARPAVRRPRLSAETRLRCGFLPTTPSSIGWIISARACARRSCTTSHGCPA